MALLDEPAKSKPSTARASKAPPAPAPATVLAQSGRPRPADVPVPAPKPRLGALPLVVVLLFCVTGAALALWQLWPVPDGTKGRPSVPDRLEIIPEPAPIPKQRPNITPPDDSKSAPEPKPIPKPIPPPPSPVFHDITITTTPGARIEITEITDSGNKAMPVSLETGSEGRRWRAKLTSGRYEVAARLAGYDAANESFSVPDKCEITLYPQPKPAKGTILSAPSGAEIFLDGNPTGKRTPDSITVSGFPGEHQIALVREGYRRKSQPWSPEPGREDTIDFGNLDPTLKIRLNIKNAGIKDLTKILVSINGDTGKTPTVERRSLVLEDVAEGEHTLKLVCDGYKEHELKVRVGEQSPAPERDIDFIPNPAILTLTWSEPGPSECEIFINGNRIRPEPYHNGEILSLPFSDSAPVFLAKARGFTLVRPRTISLKTPGEKKPLELFFQKDEPKQLKPFSIRFVAAPGGEAPNLVRFEIKNRGGGAPRQHKKATYALGTPVELPWIKGTCVYKIEHDDYDLVEGNFKVGEAGELLPIAVPFKRRVITAPRF
jgi:hypothetical protein